MCLVTLSLGMKIKLTFRSQIQNPIKNQIGINSLRRHWPHASHIHHRCNLGGLCGVQMSLVHALHMTSLSRDALHLVWFTLSAEAILSANHANCEQRVHTPGVSHSKCENSSRCTPQQVHIWSAQGSGISHSFRFS